jgi:hypothetical protein
MCISEEKLDALEEQKREILRLAEVEPLSDETSALLELVTMFISEANFLKENVVPKSQLSMSLEKIRIAMATLNKVSSIGHDFLACT